MYFQNFPTIYYEFEIDGVKTLRSVVDVTQNVRIISDLLKNITLYDEYAIQEGDTPEIVSHKIYGSPLYHWIIMIANNRFNYLTDWPMTSGQFDEYVEKAYGSDLYATRYHINANGYIVNSDEPGAQPISNYEHEYNLNESKRHIKIISPQLLSRIITQFDQLI